MAKKKTLWNAKMKRRSFLKYTGAAAGAGILGASGFSAPLFAQERTISIIKGAVFPGPREDKMTRELADEWTKQTGVKVVIESIPANNLQAKVSTSIELGAGQDIFFMLHNWAHLYTNQLTDLSDIAEKLGSRYGGYYDAPKSACMVDGVWRSVPYNILPNVQTYRKDWFDEVGATTFPDTWEELRAVGKKLKEKGKPFGETLGHSFADPVTFVYPFLWSNGGKEIAEDGKTFVLDSPETHKAMEFMKGMWDDAYFPGGMAWDDTSNNRASLGGQISCTLNGASIYVVAKDKFPDLAKVTYQAPHPKGPAGRFHFNLQISHGIPKYSKNADAAKEFILFLMDEPQYSRWMDAVLGYYTGPNPYWEKHPVWEKEPKMQAARDAGKVGGTMGSAGPPNRASAEVLSKYLMVDLFARVCKGEPIDSAIKWAADEMKKSYGA
jgi:multiple sugar transport system substrate-binding protein